MRTEMRPNWRQRRRGLKEQCVIHVWPLFMERRLSQSGVGERFLFLAIGARHHIAATLVELICDLLLELVAQVGLADLPKKGRRVQSKKHEHTTKQKTEKEPPRQHDEQQDRDRLAHGGR